MKKLLLVAVLLCLSLTTIAQNDVTKFMGIPVDGTKSEMIRKLKEKGFTVNPYDSDVLEGEFNGTDVNIFIVTTRNKVSRIMVADKNKVDETQIRIRFNKLCEQFASNQKYYGSEDQKISEDEDISYEMSVHNKQYQAIFFQTDESTIDNAQKYREELENKYSKEELENPSEDLTNEIKNVIIELMSNSFEKMQKKPVWFTIGESYGEYNILMYYDNEYNRANGEDL